MKTRRLLGLGVAGTLAALACFANAIAGEPRAEPLPGKPQRIMSVNVCNDILLLMLVPKERIASITWLAHEPVEALMPAADSGVPTNRGTAEEVLRQKPDLILASPWSTPVLRRLAAKVGAPVVEVDAANSFEDIRRITRQIGLAVGEPARAEALIVEMDRKLAELERTRPAKPVEVAAWSSGDAVPGAGTLTDEIIRAAGATNLARRLPGASYSSFSVEELLAARPDAIMRGEGGYDAPALRDAVSEHPAIRKAFAGRRVTYPASLHACGLPQSADAVRDLRAALAKVPPGGVPW
jgi:iron complex transport system substrate-binding protein